MELYHPTIDYYSVMVGIIAGGAIPCAFVAIVWLICIQDQLNQLEGTLYELRALLEALGSQKPPASLPSLPPKKAKAQEGTSKTNIE